MVEHRTLALTPARPQVATRTRGVVYVHAAPRALAPAHRVGAGRRAGHAVHLDWTAQPVAPGTWGRGLLERAARARPRASSRRCARWDLLRVEVTEEPANGHEGERYGCTPTSASSGRRSARTATSRSARSGCAAR